MSKKKRLPRIAPHGQKEWTEEEVTRAWRLKNRGKSNREIGLILNRTESSVHYMIGRTYD